MWNVLGSPYYAILLEILFLRFSDKMKLWKFNISVTSEPQRNEKISLVCLKL